MPNKHFCQGPECHTNPTQDRFLKSRGVVRGRYAYANMDRTPNSWGYTATSGDRYFCSQRCKFEWLCLLYTSPSPRDRQKSRMPSSA